MKVRDLILALLAGAIGGGSATYAVLAYAQRHPAQLIRAHRFELVDGTGHSSSFWGVDSAGYEVLAFEVREENIRSRGQNHEQLAVGLQGKAGSPFFAIYGGDGQLRTLLDLDDFQRPALTMKDENGLGLTLGSERSDTPGFKDQTDHWVLSFLPDERARIGAFTERDREAIYARGFLRISPGRVSLPAARH